MFEITITEKTKVKTIGGKQWTTIDKRPYLKDEVPDQYWQREDMEKKAAKGEILIKEVMGYTPEKEVEETVTREILKQTVEAVDLQKVIKAINNIE